MLMGVASRQPSPSIGNGMSKEKESKQQRKDRIKQQGVVIQEWYSDVRKYIKLPDGLKGTLIAMVDASRKGKQL